MCYEASWYKLYHLNEGLSMPFVALIGGGSLIAVATRIDFPSADNSQGLALEIIGERCECRWFSKRKASRRATAVPIGNVSGGRKVRGEKGRLPIGRSLPSCPTRRRIPRQGRLRNFARALLRSDESAAAYQMDVSTKRLMASNHGAQKIFDRSYWTGHFTPFAFR